MRFQRGSRTKRLSESRVRAGRPLTLHRARNELASLILHLSLAPQQHAHGTWRQPVGKMIQASLTQPLAQQRPKHGWFVAETNGREARCLPQPCERRHL